MRSSENEDEKIGDCANTKNPKEGNMKKALVLFIAVVALSFAMNAKSAKADPTIIPTSQSVIEASLDTHGKARLKVSGDLSGKVSWVEVYYEKPQEGNKYTLRLPLVSDGAIIPADSVLGFNFGSGASSYVLIDPSKEFPGKTIGVSKKNDANGQGAKFVIASK